MKAYYDWMKEGFTVIPNSLLVGYRELGLDERSLVFVIYLLSLLNQGVGQKTFEEMSRDLAWPVDQVSDQLNQLMDQQYLSIEWIKDANGKQTDHYSLRGLFDQLNGEANSTNMPQTASAQLSPSQAQQQQGDFVGMFEQEFGRVLTPLELETLNHWLHDDQYSEALIRMALKEAVINQALSLNYIDKILLNWSKKNIRTPQEAQREIKRFADKQTHKSELNQSKYDHFKIPIVKLDDPSQ